MKFMIKQGWIWEIRYSNGQLAAKSNTYSTKNAAKRGLGRFLRSIRGLWNERLWNQFDEL